MASERERGRLESDPKEDQNELAARLDKDLDEFIENLARKRSGGSFVGWDKETCEKDFLEHPFFRTKPFEEGEELPPLFQALQDLKYDDEINSDRQLALTFKQDGNRFFGARRYRLAVQHYSRGLAHRPPDQLLVTQLLTNRAAAHYHLQNWRSCRQDCLRALLLCADHQKALQRAAQACLRLGRHAEATRWCDLALQHLTSATATTSSSSSSSSSNDSTSISSSSSNGTSTTISNSSNSSTTSSSNGNSSSSNGNSSSSSVKDDISRRREQLQQLRATIEGERRLAEREGRRRQRQLQQQQLHQRRLATAVASRQLKVDSNGSVLPLDLATLTAEPTLLTAQLPGVQGGGVQLVAESGELTWPVLLIYPEYSQTDLFQCVSEHAPLSQLLSTALHEPPQWAGPPGQCGYSPDGVHVYYESCWQRECLVKVSSASSLAQILCRPDYAIKCGVPSLMVLVSHSQFECSFLARYQNVVS